MSSHSLSYVGYADGASRHTRHIASAAWVLYTPESNLLGSGGIFLGNATNNVAEYMSVIQLLTEAASRDISNLVVRLDSQLIIMQLNNHYHVRHLVLLRYFLRVQILQRQFQTITFEHVRREFNTLADSLANYVLDWHLSHLL